MRWLFGILILLAASMAVAGTYAPRNTVKASASSDNCVSGATVLGQKSPSETVDQSGGAAYFIRGSYEATCTGYISTVGARLNGFATNEYAVIGIYNSSDVLLGNTNSIQGTGVADDKEASLQSAVHVTQGETYYLAVGANASFYIRGDTSPDTGVSTSHDQASSYTYSANTLPSAFGSFTTIDATVELNIWALAQ